MSNEIPDLPDNNNEFWEGAETYRYQAKDMGICKTHGRHNWLSHQGYVENKDGTFSCVHCSWGGILDGRYRIIDGKAVDLKGVAVNW